MKEIRFYRTNDEYGYFSNFARYPMILESFVWPTVEHYFQAKKFSDFRIQDKIRAMASPMDAANEGRKISNPIVNNWDEIKEEVMLKAVKAKFLQYPSLRRNLLNTGDAIIIEHTSNDSYWADGGDGSGKNRLGHLLMEVRQYLWSIEDAMDVILPPWIAFSDVDKADMFWHMGLGEGYLDNLFKWMDSLSDIALRNYKIKYSEPPEWEGFYDE